MLMKQATSSPDLTNIIGRIYADAGIQQPRTETRHTLSESLSTPVLSVGPPSRLARAAAGRPVPCPIAQAVPGMVPWHCVHTGLGVVPRRDNARDRQTECASSGEHVHRS